MAKTAKAFAAEEAAPAPEAEAMVNVRITKKGDGKVSTGKHIGGEGDELYEAGEIVSLPRSIAEQLEDAGHAEIQGEAEAAPAPAPESEVTGESGKTKG